MRKLLGVIGAMAIVLSGLILSTAAPAAAQVDTGAMESAFVAKINALRASKGLGTLVVDGELTQIARAWSAKMVSDGEISHNPNFPNQVTQDWQKLGENVGRGNDVDSLFQAFVNSPKHYENLVDPAFTHVGVGVVMSGNTIFTSHQFMRLRSGATAAPAPTAAPRPTATRAPAAPRTTSAPRATTPRPAATPATAPAPKPTPVKAAPAPPPAPPVRVVMSLELLAGRGI